MRTRRAVVAPLASESGFALIGALLVMVLVTALGSAAIFQSQLDLMLAGNYRVQRTAETAADGALDLVKAMIFGNTPTLNLPLSIPSTDAAARAWRAGPDTNGDGVGDGVTYKDQDIDVTFTIKYKQEDNINLNAAENHVDEVVRYGKDYRYQSAQKDIGKQPVYTVTFTDNRTGAKGETDLISTIGFRTAAAIYVKGKIRMTKNPYANEEMIEVTAGAGTPAVATTKSMSDLNVFIQRAVALPNNSGTQRSYTEQTDTTGGTDTYTYFPDYRAEASVCDPMVLTIHPNPPTPFCPLTTLSLSAGIYAVPNQCWKDLYPRVYSDAEIAAEITAGRYNSARDKMHILLGVGERGDRDDPTNATKPGYLDGAASYAASKAIFNFDVTDQAVVKYDYRNSDGSIPALEDLLGSTFADLRSLADVVLTGDQTVKNFNCNDLSGGKDLSGMTLGTEAQPQIVFFNSNMNDDGTPNGQPELSLVTTSGSVHGYGILVINGDAVIYGSIDWTGLMVVRGKLVFKPWQGGTPNFRSGTDLSTHWNGFIMIGGDPNDPSSLDDNYGLHLWTYYGGSLFLGYSSSEVATVKGIISATIPHQVLSWRRTYN